MSSSASQTDGPLRGLLILEMAARVHSQTTLSSISQGDDNKQLEHPSHDNECSEFSAAPPSQPTVSHDREVPLSNTTTSRNVFSSSECQGDNNDSVNSGSSPIVPTNKDVLFGRGGKSNNHKGNQFYHNVKNELQVFYQRANSKKEKAAISRELVNRIKRGGGRFLAQDNDTGLWYEVTDDKARRKSSQALREINTPEVRAKKRAKYYSSATTKPNNTNKDNPPLSSLPSSSSFLQQHSSVKKNNNNNNNEGKEIMEILEQTVRRKHTMHDTSNNKNAGKDITEQTIMAAITTKATATTTSS